MANRNMPRQHLEIFFAKRLVDQSKMGMRDYSPAVGRGNARAFLAPVLQCIKAEKGQAGDILSRRMDAKDAALFMELIAVKQLLKIHWVMLGVFHAVLG